MPCGPIGAPGLGYGSALSVYVPDMRVGSRGNRAFVRDEKSCRIRGQLNYVLRIAARHAELRRKRRPPSPQVGFEFGAQDNPD